MTARQLAKALEGLGWSPAQLGRRIGCSEFTVRRMLKGERPIEPEIGDWLDQVQAIMQAAPDWTALDKRYTAQD